MYSLMLSEDIVSAIDRLAYEAGTNRSNMINSILAEYISYKTPEMRIKTLFETIEDLISNYDGFKVMLRSSDSLFNLRSALTFKYNPTVNYSIELYRSASDALGELRASLRTQNLNLKLYIMQFYKLWAKFEMETGYSGGDYSINGEKFIKKLILHTHNDKRPLSENEISEAELCQAIVSYINAFDSALKAFFYNLDNAQEAVAQVEAIYKSYRNNNKILL
jgi:hypothetical protein